MATGEATYFHTCDNCNHRAKGAVPKLSVCGCYNPSNQKCRDKIICLKLLQYSKLKCCDEIMSQEWMSYILCRMLVIQVLVPFICKHTYYHCRIQDFQNHCAHTHPPYTQRQLKATASWWRRKERRRYDWSWFMMTMNDTRNNGNHNTSYLYKIRYSLNGLTRPN